MAQGAGPPPMFGVNRSNRNPKRKADAWAKEDRKREAARLSRLGWTERAIAAHLGVGPSTICRDLREVVEELIHYRVSDAEGMRALAKERIHTALVATTAVLREAKAAKQPETILKAVDRLVHLEERLARMFGTDAPERVEQTLTEGPTPTEAARLVREVFASVGASAAVDGRASTDDGGDPGDAPPADDPNAGSVG